MHAHENAACEGKVVRCFGASTSVSFLRKRRIHWELRFSRTSFEEWTESHPKRKTPNSPTFSVCPALLTAAVVPRAKVVR